MEDYRTIDRETWELIFTAPVERLDRILTTYIVESRPSKQTISILMDAIETRLKIHHLMQKIKTTKITVDDC